MKTVMILFVCVLPLAGHAHHHAGKMYDHPLGAAMLYALEVPPDGGDTYFSNMYLALDTLPPRLRERIYNRCACLRPPRRPGKHARRVAEWLKALAC